MTVARRKPVSQKGEETRERILEKASYLFLHQGYHPTSMVQIARKGSISPAAVYQYFQSKEEIYKEILRDFENDFFARIDLVGHPQLKKKLDDWVKQMMEAIWDFQASFRVFRGAEFVQFDAAKEFHNRWMEQVVSTFFPDSDSIDAETGSWFLVGPLLYVATKWVFWNSSPVPAIYQESLVDFYMHGISPHIFHSDIEIKALLNQPDRIHIAPNMERNDPSALLNKGEQTRQKILKAAEAWFGSKGYYHTHIHEIASSADCGVGTVYLYFPSKLEILRELVEEVNQQLRAMIRSATQHLTDRRDMELAAYGAFLKFFDQHRKMYGIVRESEFVDHSISSAYYGRLEQGYRKVMDQAIDKGEIRPIDPQLIAWCLMGLGHTMGESLLIFGDMDEDGYMPYLESLGGYLFNGLANHADGCLTEHTNERIAHKKG